MSTVNRATAIAHPNIALAKYWGKRAYGHNLPAVPSLSVTLAGLATTTEVAFDPTLKHDELHLGGVAVPPDTQATRRVAGLLDRVRAASGRREHARVVSRNDFPTAAGLASSASAFSALALAASAAAGLPTAPETVSDLARKTSVSAARSAFGGFVELRAGRPGDETLAATPVAAATHWPLAVVIAVTREGPKDIGSSEGMRHTVMTSPYFPAWVASAPALFGAIREAVLARDFSALSAAAEASALQMHASSIAADPGLIYWTGATVEVIAEVRRLRASGAPVFFTIDAGPHVKVFTMPEARDAVARALLEVPGVLRTIAAAPGGAAHLVAGSDEQRPRR
jgi:diphosphomevalonate decarboxylase